MNTLAALIREYLAHWAHWFLIVPGLTVPAFAAEMLAPPIALKFGFGEGGETLVRAICFFGLLAIEAGIYDRYQRWQSLREEPRTHC